METYNGHVRTPQDAIILFEACRLGALPRVQRRLSEKERQQIRSGSVFVWDEREAGMRRWTDGKSWSASRVSGSFLTYREMEGKRGGNGFPSQPVRKSNSRVSNDGSRSGEGDNDSGEDGPDGYRYKPDGLMKQSFSITTNNGQHLHLISYYARSQPTAAPLKQPSNDPSLRHIRPQKGMYPEATVNEATNVPAVTRGPMPGSPYSTAPQQLAVAPPYGHGLVPQGYPPPPHPSASWPGSPVGAPYGYYAHPPPPGYPMPSPHHQHPYPYAHPYAIPPSDRPPHLSHLPPPPSSLANGHTPPHLVPIYQQPPGRPPFGSAISPHTPVQQPNQQTANGDSRPRLQSPGTATTTAEAQNGASYAPSLHILAANGHKPITPPPSTSTSNGVPERPQSSDASMPTSTASNGKVLPTIGALIHGDATPQSVQAAAQPAVEQRNGEANGNPVSRSNSRSPSGAHGGGPNGPQLRDLPGEKGSCRADIMAIAALDGRFNKPTT